MHLPPSAPAPDADDDAIRGVYHVSSENMRAAGLNITLGSLPMLQFASGHVYFVQLLPQRLGITPCAVHTTFQCGDTSQFGFGKRQRMRSAGAWHLDNATYFGHADPNKPGRAPSFLALEGGTLEPLLTDPPFSPALLSVWAGRNSRGAPGASTGAALHLAAEAVQRERLRDALALARSLNRALILPRLSCYCDRHYWLTRACRHPDAPGFPLPIADCPLDHVHEPDKWERAGLDFRAAVCVVLQPARDPTRLTRPFIVERAFWTTRAWPPKCGRPPRRCASTRPHPPAATARGRLKNGGAVHHGTTTPR